MTDLLVFLPDTPGGASFSAAFDAVFQSAGVRVIRCAVQAPRMNSIMERWVQLPA